MIGLDVPAFRVALVMVASSAVLVVPLGLMVA
jgi:hypothetical protein